MLVAVMFNHAREDEAGAWPRRAHVTRAAARRGKQGGGPV
jgi:hypothetical protein